MSRLPWLNPFMWWRRLVSWWRYRPGGPYARATPQPERAEVGDSAEEALDTLRALGYSFVYVPNRQHPERIAALKRKGELGWTVTDVTMITGDHHAYGLRLKLKYSNVFDPFDTTNVEQVTYATAGDPLSVITDMEGIGPPDQAHGAGLALKPGPLAPDEVKLLESFNVKGKVTFVPPTGWASQAADRRRDGSS